MDGFPERPWIGSNDADDSWLGSCLKGFQKDLGANYAVDAWLGWLLKAFQRDFVANDADDAWLGMLMMRGFAGC